MLLPAASSVAEVISKGTSGTAAARSCDAIPVQDMAGAMPEEVLLDVVALTEAEVEAVACVLPVAPLASAMLPPVTSARPAARVAMKVADFHRCHLNSVGMRGLHSIVGSRCGQAGRPGERGAFSGGTAKERSSALISTQWMSTRLSTISSEIYPVRWRLEGVAASGEFPPMSELAIR